MFIYRFMSGLVESAVGAEEDEDFDPHQHRRVPKPTTYAETMTHMLKGSLGAGLLAMPNAVYRMGIVLGGGCIILIGIFATYCIQLLIFVQYRICKKARRGYMAYPKSMRLSIQSGPRCVHWSAGHFARAVDVMLVFWQLGICAIYCVFVGENIKQILDYYGAVIELRLLILCFYPILLGMCMIKDLKKLAPFSTFSNFLVVVGLILVFYYLIEDDIVIDNEKFKLKGLTEIPIFIGMVLFALEAVGVVLALEYNMENPRQFTGLCGLFSVGMAIIIGLYAVLGVCGYLKYGSDAKGSVTLNLPHDEKKAQVAKLTFAIALFLSFPLQNFVGHQIIWRRLLKLKPRKERVADIALRVLLVSIPFALAIAAPKLGPFMGLLGALCLSMVAIVFPALMDAAVRYPNDYGFWNYKLFVDMFIVVFGTICMLSGVYTSLLEMYETYDL